MPDASQIAAAINLRVRQLEAQGITGVALANHMIGHMQDLHRIYNTASDRTLRDLCHRFPGFERYARLMEEVSEQNQAMVSAGTHPYGDLPELPEPLKASLLHVMHAAAELEREFQAAVDGRRDRAVDRHEAAMGRRSPETGARIPILRFAAADPGAGAAGGEGCGGAD